MKALKKQLEIEEKERAAGKGRRFSHISFAQISRQADLDPTLLTIFARRQYAEKFLEKERVTPVEPIAYAEKKKKMKMNLLSITPMKKLKHSEYN